MIWRTLSRALAIVAVLAVPAAQAVTLCAKRSGKIVAREACKKRETAAIPGAIAIVGPTGPQGAGGPAGAPGIIPHEVVDATGKQFGTLLSWQGGRAQVIAAVPGVDVPLQFNIDQGDFFNLGGAQQDVFYDSAGCSGAPFIRDAGGLVPAALVFGTRAYFSRSVPTQQTVASREFRPSTPGDCGESTDTGRQTCCTDVASMDALSPADTFEVSVLGVTPPFTVVPR